MEAFRQLGMGLISRPKAHRRVVSERDPGGRAVALIAEDEGFRAGGKDPQGKSSAAAVEHVIAPRGRFEGRQVSIGEGLGTTHRGHSLGCHRFVRGCH